MIDDHWPHPPFSFRRYYMLENVNLKQKISKKDYKKLMDELEPRLSELTRRSKAAQLPVMIIFEGWGASGKGTLINRLIQPLDPRGFKVFTIKKESEDERMHPIMWRFWTKTPEKGRIHIFDRSWYRRVVSDEKDNPRKPEELPEVCQQILSFEEQLTTDGTLIIKFFLHISQDEQKDRLKKLDEQPETTWRVTKDDWRHNEQYGDYLALYDMMLEKTDTACAPWHIIEAEDRRYASAKIMSITADILEEALAVKEAQANAEHADEPELETVDSALRTSILAGVDMNKTISEKQYKKRLKELQDEMDALHSEIYKKRIPVVIAFEGWDAAGKGGAIKRLTEKMDPRGYEVVPTAAPNDIEKKHHYLWRFWQAMPKDGHAAIFDRTWYGRVMVERIEHFCTTEEWKRAYKEINQMEADLYAHGTVIIKFWMQIDKDEQENRFNERMNNPEKQWKITEEDWRNRAKWDEYEKAVDEMILRTSTTYAPWHIVPANSKQYARIMVLETVIETLKKRIEKKD